MSDEINDQDTPIQVPPELGGQKETSQDSEVSNTNVPPQEEGTADSPTVATEDQDVENPADGGGSSTEGGQSDEANPSQETCIQLSDIQSVVSGAEASLLSKMEELQKAFDSKLRYDAKKDAVIQRQADELEKFHKGLIEKSTLSIAQDLIAEVDSAEKLGRFYDTAECTEDNFRKLKKALKDVSLSLCDVLEKYGIIAYRTVAGEAFDPRRQRARLTTKTGDKALDKTVKTLLGAGFEQEREDGTGTKVLRPELVDVYVFDPSLVPAPAAESAPVAESAETATPKPDDVPVQSNDAGTSEALV